MSFAACNANKEAICTQAQTWSTVDGLLPGYCVCCGANFYLLVELNFPVFLIITTPPQTKYSFYLG